MRDDKRSSVAIPLIIGVAVLSLPVLYVLSTGPACWLESRGYVSAELVGDFYIPLRLFTDRCEPFCDVVNWYDSFFFPTE